MKLPIIRPLICAAVASVALLAWPTESRAGESYDNCTGFIDSLPAVITTQGTWCLRTDLSTAITEGAAVTIATNNVTVDCNDFKIGGLAAGLGTLANGVAADSRLNTTVRNCRIRGFRIGISLSGEGGGHRVEDNHLEGGRSIGMFIAGAGSLVRGNRVMDSGGSSRSALAVEAGIQVALGVDVIDNVVSGVRPPVASNRSAAGIFASSNAGGSIIGNRISGLVAQGSGEVMGIRVRAINRSELIAVSGNILKGQGAPSTTGIVCASFGTGSADVISKDNVLIGFGTAYQNCTTGEDSINTR